MFGVGSIPWSPLGRGMLTHPLKEETLRSKTDPCVQFPHIRPVGIRSLYGDIVLPRYQAGYKIPFLPELVGRYALPCSSGGIPCSITR